MLDQILEFKGPGEKFKNKIVKYTIYLIAHIDQISIRMLFEITYLNGEQLPI